MSLEIHHKILSRENDIKSWFNLNSKTGSLKLTKYGYEKLTHGNCKYYQKIKKFRQIDFILTIANLDDYLKLEGQVVLNSTQKFSRVDFQMEFVNFNICTLNSLKKVIVCWFHVIFAKFWQTKKVILPILEALNVDF